MDDVILSPLENISKKQIEIGPHVYEKIDEGRTINDEWVYNCLVNGEKLGILKQRDNRYKIWYEHPVKLNRYDLIIVVDIINSPKKIIRVVTSYEQSAKRRLK